MEEVARYLDAFDKAVSALERVRALSGSVRKMDSHLGEWLHAIDPLMLPKGPPPAAVMASIKRLCESGWPTAAEIVEAIEAYDVAIRTVEEAWKAIPPEKRSALYGPDRVPSFRR